MEKNFQELDIVQNSELLTDYEQVVTKASVDKRMPFSRIKSEIIQGVTVESGLHNEATTKKPRLGGTLLEDVTIDGASTKRFDIVNAKAVQMTTAGTSAKTTLDLGTALSIPTRIRTENTTDPLQYGQLVIDADGNTEIGQKTSTDASGMKMSNAQQVTMYNKDYVVGVKVDGIYAENLPAKTTETDIVYIAPDGKLSKGVAPTVGAPAYFGVAYEKQIPFTNSASIAQATIETAFRATVSNAVLNGYYIADFRCTQSTPLSKSATVNYQISGQSAATLTAKHGMSVLFKYVNNVLTDIEALTDSAIVDAITAIQNTTTSETANQLIDTDTIHFTTGAGNLPLNRQLQPHVQIPALIDQSTGPNHLGQIVPMSQAFISSVGQIRVPLLNFQNSQSVEFVETVNSTTKERVVTANVQATVLPSADSGNMAKLGTDDNIYVGGEQDFKILENLTSSFFLAGSAVCTDVIQSNPLTNIYDVIGNFDTNTKTLFFVNNSPNVSGKSKAIRMSKIQIVAQNTSGILDNGSDFILSFPKSFLKQNAHNQIFVTVGLNSVFPTPTIWNIEGAGTRLSPFVKVTDANVQVNTWTETQNGIEAYYMKFQGMDLMPKFQIQLQF